MESLEVMGKFFAAIGNFFRRLFPMSYKSSAKEFERLSEAEKAHFDEISEQLEKIRNDLSSAINLCQESNKKADAYTELLVSFAEKTHDSMGIITGNSEACMKMLADLSDNNVKLKSDVLSAVQRETE